MHVGLCGSAFVPILPLAFENMQMHCRRLKFPRKEFLILRGNVKLEDNEHVNTTQLTFENVHKKVHLFR